LEVKKEIAKKKRDELFNRDNPMVPKVTWRDKYIAKKTDNSVYTKLKKTSVNLQPGEIQCLTNASVSWRRDTPRIIIPPRAICTK
jgi:hypothetical protein